VVLSKKPNALETNARKT